MRCRTGRVRVRAVNGAAAAWLRSCAVWRRECVTWPGAHAVLYVHVRRSLRLGWQASVFLFAIPC